VELHAVLHKRFIRPAAERVHPRQNVREVLSKVFGRQPVAVVAQKAGAVAAGDHKYAPARRAAIGLDDEIGALGERPRKGAQLRMSLDHRVDIRRGRPDSGAQAV
jgi:hypothetical protein